MRKSICLLGVMATLMICNHCMAVRARQEAYGALAQLGERVPCKDEVQGSSP